MSHTTTIDLEVKDLEALEEACSDLGYQIEHNVDVKLYERGSAFQNATRIKIPGWEFPVVVKDGKVHYDNYEGVWGSQDKLDALKQRYARNAAIRAAKRKGYRVTETKVGGKIKLTLSR